jgi:tRNA threonylcarbamoyladenosine biosynthesis protein TsaE
VDCRLPTTLTSQSEDDTLELGRRLGALLAPGHVVGLVGELGAGKTCLARGAALGALVDPSVYVSSPTFTLVNEYPGRIPLYHIDLYRIGSGDELIEVGFEDYLRGDGACLVEWFDRFPEHKPPEHLELHLIVVGDQGRRVELRPSGEVHRRLADAWIEACTPPA